MTYLSPSFPTRHFKFTRSLRRSRRIAQLYALQALASDAALSAQTHSHTNTQTHVRTHAHKHTDITPHTPHRNHHLHLALCLPLLQSLAAAHRLVQLPLQLTVPAAASADGSTHTRVTCHTHASHVTPALRVLQLCLFPRERVRHLKHPVPQLHAQRLSRHNCMRRHVCACGGGKGRNVTCHFELRAQVRGLWGGRGGGCSVRQRVPDVIATVAPDANDSFLRSSSRTRRWASGICFVVL